MHSLLLILLSAALGSLFALVVPKTLSSGASSAAPSASGGSNASAETSPRSGNASLPAGIDLERPGTFAQLPANQQAAAILRLTRGLSGRPTPADLSVVCDILRPLDWNASTELWSLLTQSKDPALRPHQDLLQLLAEHLAKIAPAQTLELSLRVPDMDVLQRAAFTELLHRDAAEALRAFAKLPTEFQKDQNFYAANPFDRADMHIGKLSGSFANAAQVLEEQTSILAHRDFVFTVLAQLALEETQDAGSVLERVRTCAHRLAHALTDLSPEQKAQFEKRSLGTAREAILLRRPESEIMQPGETDTLQTRSLKALRLGLSEGLGPALESIEKTISPEDLEGVGKQALAGALLGAHHHDPSAALADLEKLQNTRQGQMALEIGLPFLGGMQGYETLDSMPPDAAIRNTVALVNDLHLSPELALAYYTRSLSQKSIDSGHFEFFDPFSRIPSHLLIEMLPLNPEQKRSSTAAFRPFRSIPETVLTPCAPCRFPFL